MQYANRIILFAYLGIGIVAVHVYANKQSEIQYIERTKTMSKNEHKQSEWLSYVKKQTALTAGTFSAKDSLGTSVLIKWERVDPQSPRLNEVIKGVSGILVETYTQGEILFAKKHPDAVAQQHFLQSVAPLFENGADKVDWKLVEKQVKTTFNQVFTQTDFAQFSSAEDIHLFMIAQDAKTGTTLGILQFLVTPKDTYGNVKAAYYGVAPSAHNRGLEKVLMSSIFKVLPAVTRIFMHTRSTNESLVSMYQSWGFMQFAQSLEYWTNLQYLTDQSDALQKEAEAFGD